MVCNSDGLVQRLALVQHAMEWQALTKTQLAMYTHASVQHLPAVAPGAYYIVEALPTTLTALSLEFHMRGVHRKRPLPVGSGLQD